MLTISQLADYAEVTVAAVRQHHKIGLLPEPGRDRSSYRRYDAAAVVRLIRIHMLAGAGVPLSQVEDLLDADQETFAEHVRGIDARLRAEVRKLQDTRERLAQLAGGDQLTLPASVVGYLDRLRRLGVEESYLERERDAWIIIAAQVPEHIDAIITRKHEDLRDPDVVRLYSLASTAPDWTADDLAWSRSRTLSTTTRTGRRSPTSSAMTMSTSRWRRASTWRPRSPPPPRNGSSPFSKNGDGEGSPASSPHLRRSVDTAGLLGDPATARVAAGPIGTGTAPATARDPVASRRGPVELSPAQLC